MDDQLVRFLRERYDEQRQALIQYRDGHDGPCINYLGQPPGAYSEFDSCALHLQAAGSTPYRDVEFGLADLATKRRVLDEVVPEMNDMTSQIHGEFGTGPLNSGDYESLGLLRLLALPYADHPQYRDEWRPTP